jgi:uncharacterized DUF497 family protein
MSALRFEWDPAKAAANLRKHGVAFEEARTVFEDAEALLIPAPDHSEPRRVLRRLPLLRDWEYVEDQTDYHAPSDALYA